MPIQFNSIQNNYVNLVLRVVKIVLVFSLGLISTSSAFAYTTNMSASVVVGQSTFTSSSTGSGTSSLNNTLRGVFVDPNEVDDDKLTILVHDIARKLEKEAEPVTVKLETVSPPIVAV